MTILDRLEKSKDFWFLVGLSFLFFLLRLPGLFEPYWYGDEGIYQVIGMAISSGRLLYQGIWDNKPPLLYLLYALWNGDQFFVRFTSLIFGILSIIAFFLLAKKLFRPSVDYGVAHKRKSQLIVYCSTLLFAFLFGIPMLEGNIANAENFMLLPILVGALLIYKHVSRQSSVNYTPYAIRYTLFSSGLLLGLAFLFKVVAVFDATAFFLFIVMLRFTNVRRIPEIIKELFFYGVGFILPIGITAIFFFLNGAFSDFFKASFLQNVGYVGYGNQLLIPQGFLILKLFLLGIVVAVLFFRRKKFSKTLLFIFLWFSFSLFNAFFSQRPYTHYMLVLLPSTCLFLGYIFWEKKNRLIHSLLFLLILTIVYKNFTFYSHSISYYENFVSFLTSQKSVADYQGFFDKNTPIDYQIAQYITLHARDTDNVYIWGNNAQLYKLINKLPPGRYIVAYHVTFYKEGIPETANTIEKAKPQYIVIMPNTVPFPFSLVEYREKVMIEGVTIYERIL